MEHPGEHRIELYVLRAPLGERERLEIEFHLGECEGCRRLAESASSYYADLQIDILTRPAEFPDHSRHLPVRSARFPAIFDPPFRDIPLSQIHPPGTVRRFVRAHPFVAGGGGLALLGGLAFLMLTFDLMPARDLALSTVIANPASSTLDAYNKEGEKLWSYPVERLNDLMAAGQRTGQPFVQVADLYGDGRKEMLTALPSSPDGAPYSEVLHIINNENKEILAIRPGEALTCRGRIYPGEFRITGFSVGDFSGSGRNEIIIVMGHLHSPTVVSLYDAGGSQIGTYKHFGQIRMMGTTPIDAGKGKEFVLYGMSDSKEGINMQVVIGLDPSRLIGDGESSYSGGFGLPVSGAERHYAWIPRTDVVKEYGGEMVIGGAKAVLLQHETGFRIETTAQPDSIPAYFEYIFRADFGIVEVKSANSTKNLYDRLAARGRVSGDFFDGYMKTVAGEIRYWDGHTWQPRPVEVLAGRNPSAEPAPKRLPVP
jgi:hypothetical protein